MDPKGTLNDFTQVNNTEIHHNVNIKKPIYAHHDLFEFAMLKEQKKIKIINQIYLLVCFFCCLTLTFDCWDR